VPTELIREHRNRSIVFGPRHSAIALFAAYDSSLPVKSVAVGIPCRLAERAYRASGLIPAEDSVIWNVAPEKIATGGYPDWTFRPPATSVQAFQRVVALA
jgi:hypothetical protein